MGGDGPKKKNIFISAHGKMQAASNWVKEEPQDAYKNMEVLSAAFLGIFFNITIN